MANVTFYENPDPSMIDPPLVPGAELQQFSKTLAEQILEALQIIQSRGV
jgi:hypothetical protein